MSPSQHIPGRATPNHLLLLVIVAILSFACSHKQSREVSSTATTTPQTGATPEIVKPVSSPATALGEVQAAVDRVCAGAVTIETSRSEPFLIGDFNSDGSEDLAVIVRPATGALPKLNSEYANWIIEDPRKVVLPDPNKAVQRLPKAPAAVTVQSNDLLLLVLHGYQEAGWHHEYARQTFLLRNAVGENLRAQAISELSRADGTRKPFPARPGYVISEKLTGREGFLYWTNGRYAWWE
jgi:hypothetical protein